MTPLRTRPLTLAALAGLFWLSCLPGLAGAEFYVAPTGADTNPGTKTNPFLTIQRAQQSVTPGDTVLIRGGRYELTESQISRKRGLYATATALDKSGKQGAPIRYFAFPGETPVFDCSKIKPSQRVAAFAVTGSWIHLRGLEVVGVQVVQTGHTQSICFFNNGSDNIYEGLSMHDGQAIGIYSVNGSNNLFLNCDAYRNHDFTSENKKGGNVDGFGCHPTKGSVGNVFRGCRAWFNSDDGFDLIGSSESVTFENCWSFWNGFSHDFKSLADGNGFKAGGYGDTEPGRLPTPIPRHVIRFCLAVRNKAAGFYANHHPGGSDWISNSAFNNSANFKMLNRVAGNGDDVAGYGHVMRNNLGFGGRRELADFEPSKNDTSGNYFNLELKLAEKDFLSLDEKLLTTPRKPDGSLPDIPFMRLAPGSAAVDKGVTAGFPFKGKAPDLGCFEAR